MPPKPTTRGRGRGRGRGATAAAASRDAVPASEADAATPTPAPASAPAPTPSETTPGISGPAAAAAAAAAATAASSSRGAGATKFKPKGVRRSETERARLAEEQLRIQEQRNAEEARNQARLSRGRGGRGRGRGRGGFLRGNLRGSSAAGPLSAGMSCDYVKGEGEGKGAYGSSVIDNSRINADMLYNYVQVSDEEDGASITSTKKKRKPVMPMGIRRVEHKEEGVTMTTAAEIEAQEKAGAEDDESDEESLFVGGATGEDLSGPSKDEDAMAQPRGQIKKEGGEEDAMELDAIPEGIKTPESPELKKKTLAGEPKAKKISVALKDVETEILASDLERMVDLFTLQGDDTTATAEDGITNSAALEGHMFLFQFPPVLPPLRAVPREGTSTNPIKPEPDDDDVVMLNQPPVNIDLTQDAAAADKVKKEGDGGGEGSQAGDEEGDEFKQGGFIGNLVVRRSGKVELSWGGQKLQLMPGTQTNFLSTAVLIEEADVKEGDVSQFAGVAYGMGKIQGSFASAPTWGDEEDWVVDPDELRIPE
ncbi:hypothetical protein BT67DRAFT_371869 [Trichocladium antarcticum]|uniref:DNA-directed RNA polymerase III RPC4 n=1 Tax=Trichocladium antarcticum TaxID=1450529 RepID=A0AAN6USI8_9PEZI|nr:hypothetical protein BT67DRAFT_371869 [Trichocladium antarcticum]